MSENGEIYTAGKNFTLPPALTAWTNSTSDQLKPISSQTKQEFRGGIGPSRHCRRQCKIFASGVNFSIFTHFLCFFPLKLLKLGEIDGVKFLARKSGGVNFWTNSMSGGWILDILGPNYFNPKISTKCFSFLCCFWHYYHNML